MDPGTAVDHQHVGKHREGLVADDVAGRRDRMAEAARAPLAHEGNRPGLGRGLRDRVGQSCLPAAQQTSKFEGVVEMVLDRALHAPVTMITCSMPAAKASATM